MIQSGLSRRQVLALAAVRLLRAQQPSPTYSVDVKVVNVFATVRDKHGEIVRDLVENDFALEEDGRRQTIKYFSRQSDLPLTLGLMVDTSGSQRRLIETERRASRSFLEQVLREDKDLAFIIHFDREVELLQDVTASRKLLEKALDDLETPSRDLQSRSPGQGPAPGSGGRRRRMGGTALYDSILLGCDELMSKQSGRKALILLTDGVDNGSRVPITEAIDSAQRSDTLLYCIRFWDDQAYGGFGPGPRMGGGRRGGGMGRRPVPSQNRTDGKKILERLSKETGGGYFEVSGKHPLDQIYRRVEEELRSQYNIGYTSDKPAVSSEYRKIRLSTKSKTLIVQTRDGYYARK